MARWMVLGGEDYCCLAMRGMGDEWEPWDSPPPHLMQEAAFEMLPSRGVLEHEVLRARRGQDAYINLHRFRLPAQAGSADLNQFLTSLALRKERESAGCNRSNVGGWHSSDDLWRWPEMDGEHGRRVADVLQSALLQVEEYETQVACEMGGSATESAERAVYEQQMHTQEAWLNVSRAGNWNHFHTHPGSTLSGCYYVSNVASASSAAASCQETLCQAQCGAELLQGRLILLTSAPESVSEHSENLVHRIRDEADRKLEAQPVAETSEGLSKRVLVVDPVPGSLIVFPSFVPHLVLPLGIESAGCTICRSIDAPCLTSAPDALARRVRISLAFNHVHAPLASGAP
jgi:hypothetical protein